MQKVNDLKEEKKKDDDDEQGKFPIKGQTNQTKHLVISTDALFQIHDKTETLTGIIRNPAEKYLRINV